MSSEADVSSHLFGGFLVTKPISRPSTMSVELLPAELLTASPCLATFVPGPWALEWTWRRSDDSHSLEAAAAGVGPEHLRAVAGLVTAGLETGGFGWPNLIKTRAALEALQLVLPDPTELGDSRPGTSSQARRGFPSRNQADARHVAFGSPRADRGATARP